MTNIRKPQVLEHFHEFNLMCNTTGAPALQFEANKCSQILGRQRSQTQREPKNVVSDMNDRSILKKAFGGTPSTRSDLV